jgi:hypothetical protein
MIYRVNNKSLCNDYGCTLRDSNAYYALEHVLGWQVIGAFYTKISNKLICIGAFKEGHCPRSREKSCRASRAKRISEIRNKRGLAPMLLQHRTNAR